jgi:hypothetical protein
VSQRIKGQETEVVIIADGVPQSNLTDIKDSEFAFKMEIIQEGYLGQTTDKYDSVFKGVRGKMTLHFDNPDVFTMALKIKDKARRRVVTSAIEHPCVLGAVALLEQDGAEVVRVKPEPSGRVSAEAMIAALAEEPK